MKIIWSVFAKAELQNIFDYYNENASITIARKLVQNIVKEAHSLLTAQYKGQVEPNLSERKKAYRYLVYKNYKILYTIDETGQFIQIADVFDTRQNPIKINRKK
jgi:plasmid stabilization system protein ParE